MSNSDLSNQYFDMAVRFVNQTAKHLFLTGKAGTGKTTFLKYIKDHSPKKLAVLAPTGVAAMNAGGVTIHSFFQLPFGSFLPSQQSPADFAGGNFHNKDTLLKHLRLNSSKRSIINELELLIIDEVSMVRADLMDAVDTVLRHVRRRNIPFGGIQMLYIGDLFQLPPVIAEQEWNVLQAYYQSPFFFHSQVLQQHPPVFLELKKIYRQNDADFIKLLNNLRNNCISSADIELLNSYYNPTFKPSAKGEFIILTTHNSKADVINQKELDQLPGDLFTYEALVEGEFNTKATPADMKLQLKEGAQIMFTRNDKGEARRYYNGKLGTVMKLNKNEIHVVFPGERDTLLVERETWENIRYNYHEENDEIEQEVIGTFKQFPVRLAWAITIHKSQGLTFDKAIIDAGSSFAPGQVYVALSRLRSLDGLVLYSRIQPASVSTDIQALEFTKNEAELDALNDELREAQKHFIHDSLLEVFNWTRLTDTFRNFFKSLEKRKMANKDDAAVIINNALLKVSEQQKVADKFNNQLRQMLTLAEKDNYQHLYSRVKAASDYFFNAVLNDLYNPLSQHYEKIKKQSKSKKYRDDLERLIMTLKFKKAKLEQVVLITQGLAEGVQPDKLIETRMQQSLLKKNKTRWRNYEGEYNKKRFSEEKVNKKLGWHNDTDVDEKSVVKAKAKKGDSQRISLQMFKEGYSIAKIAEERGLVVGTVESHLISFIADGEVDVKELVPVEKLNAIMAVLNIGDGEVTATQVRETLGENFTFGEIRAVMSYFKTLRKAE